jgi:hypothetical protein
MDILYPGLGNKTWLTKGGNILLKDVDGKYSFHNSELNFLREVSKSEGDYLVSTEPVEIIVQAGLYSKFTEFCIGIGDFPIWIFIKSIHVTQDNSNYRWETCNNGGDYSFQTYHDWYVAQYPDRTWRFAYVETHYTSAEFSYDELTGSFQQDMGNLHLSNVKDGKCYYSQAGVEWIDGEKLYTSTEVLEKIGEISTFEHMWKSEYVYYSSKFEDDNYESFPISSPALTFSDKKEIVRMLKNLGVDLRQGYRRHKRIGFRKSNRR